MGKGSDTAEGGVAVEDLMVTKLCVELTSSCLLNMLPTIDMLGNHCDIPPKSACPNWAVRPPPLQRASSRTCTTAGETERYLAIRSTRSPSFAEIS